MSLQNISRLAGLLLTAVSAAWLAAGCAHWGEPVPFGAAAVRAPVQAVGHGREFLQNGFDEDLPDVIYAYVVLEGDSSGQDGAERLEAAAAAFWRALRPVGTRLLGTCYWPLDQISLEAAQRAAELSDWPVLAEYYHHDRARLILQHLGGLPGVGPFLVASRQPLGRAVGAFTAGSEPWLILDLAQVSPEKMMDLFSGFRDLVLASPSPPSRAWELKTLQARFRPLLGRDVENIIYLKQPGTKP